MSVNCTTLLPVGLLVIKRQGYSGHGGNVGFWTFALLYWSFLGHEKKRPAAILPKSTQAPCWLLIHQLISSLYFLTVLFNLLLKSDPLPQWHLSVCCFVWNKFTLFANYFSPYNNLMHRTSCMEIWSHLFKNIKTIKIAIARKLNHMRTLLSPGPCDCTGCLPGKLTPGTHTEVNQEGY